jgi:hypothetical protein
VADTLVRKSVWIIGERLGLRCQFRRTRSRWQRSQRQSATARPRFIQTPEVNVSNLLHERSRSSPPVAGVDRKRSRIDGDDVETFTSRPSRWERRTNTL